MGRAMVSERTQNVNGNSGAPTLSALLDGILPLTGDMDREIGRLRLSSAGVEKGDVFIALPGVTADGRDYVSQAVERGASAVLF